jgi:hypothetical protein
VGAPMTRVRLNHRREAADAEHLLAQVRCWWLRSQRLTAGIEELGAHLRHRVITPAGALMVASDLAVECDELAAQLAGGAETPLA